MSGLQGSWREVLCFTVPGRPVGKARARVGRGRAYTPQRTVEEEQAWEVAAFDAMRGSLPRVCLTGPVRFEMDAYYPVPKSWSKAKQLLALSGHLRPCVKPDLDNVAKLKDALKGLVWQDDAQVVSEAAEKWYSAEPRVEVRILVPEERRRLTLGTG